MKKYLTWVICLPLLISCQSPKTEALQTIAKNSDCHDKVNALENEILMLRTQVRVYEIADSIYFSRKK